MSDLLKNINKGKVRKKGVVYLSTIPPFMNVTYLTEIMSQFGNVGRIYLQPTKSKQGTTKKKKKNRGALFTEGWVEFLSKRVAKDVADQLNNKQISTQKKNRYFDHMWSIKYLPRFKWEHLSERLAYERAVYKQRMRAEIGQAKREASHFANSVELGEKLKKRQKKQIETSDGMTEYKQRKTDEEILQSKNTDAENDDRTEFLRGLFSGSAS